MQQLITDIFKQVCSMDMLDIIGGEHKDSNPENVTVIYSETVATTKGYHFHDFGTDTVKYNSDIFQVEGAEDVFIDSIKAALIKGSTIYLLFEPSEKTKSFLEAVLKSALPQAIALAQEKRRHNFKVALASAIDAKVKEYRSNIEENENDADEKESELLTLRRKVAVDRLALEALDGTVGQWKQKAEAEFEHLMMLIPNLYKSISVSDGELIALTHEIEIRHNQSMYEIGEFEVRIKLATGDLTISNQTHRVEEYDHPHINDGAACLGNIGKGIIKMLAEFELFGTLQVIHTFLHSYNSHSPYKKIEHWDPDYQDEDEDHYSSCHEDNSGYTCVECADTNCPFYEEAFEVCFDNSNLEDCINCEYQCHLGRQRIQEHQRVTT